MYQQSCCGVVCYDYESAVLKFVTMNFIYELYLRLFTDLGI